MSASDTATTHVYAAEDIVWHQTDLGPKFWLSDNLIGTDYTSCFNAQLTKFGPGGGFLTAFSHLQPRVLLPHRHLPLQIEDQSWQVTPGTVVKIPAGKQHSVVNNGTDDLIFFVIYDPPNIDGTP
jgi:hypothetical protein